ncbi:MAG: hypothetical protein ABIB71_02305 [Candidatus Woesearchaeota archaeon]
MEETITKEQKKNILQLKKLLGPTKKQDLGDKSRWENIPVEYIITANTLGIELNDYALKRLSEAEDRHYALEAIYVAQHFGKIAKKEGKEDLAKKLEAMVMDEKISTQDIALYAAKAIENELPKEKLLEKLAKTHSAGKEAERYLSKTQTKKEVNQIIDAVLVPTDKDHVHLYVSNTERSLDNIVINVYGIKDKEKEAVKNKILKTIEERIGNKLDDNISLAHLRKEESKAICLLFSALGPIAFSAITGAAYANDKSVTGLVLGGILGGICSTGAVIFGSLWHSGSKDIKRLKKENKEYQNRILPNARFKWIKDKDLEAAYNAAISEKPSKLNAFRNKSVKEAVDLIFEGDKVDHAFKEVYKQQFTKTKIKDDPNTFNID